MGRLYSPLKVFHYPDKVASLPASAPETLAPLHVRIKPTNVCGHNCYYCAYRVDGLQLGQDMNERDQIPREKMLEIVDDLEEMGVKAVTFSGGGDPFYYRHLLETATRLSKGPIRFASLTNGARLSGEVAAVFAYHATWLRISIDGWDDESYAAYRGVKEGEFSRLLVNMEAFKRLGGSCYLGVSLIIDQKNASHVHELIGRVRDTGADSIKICPCIVSNEGAANNAYHRPVYDTVKAQVGRAKDEMAGGTFEIYDTYHLLDERFDKAYHWCPYLQVLPIIGADLIVYSCQDKAYNLACGPLGSIKDRRFKDFWFDGREKFFAIDPSRDCNHHCVANGKNQLILDYLESDAAHLGFV